MSNFVELGLKEEILRSIGELNFETPTPIQERVINTLLENDTDLVGLAQTGTGKTAAFGLPVLQLTDMEVSSIQTLVLAPTRELCMQIARNLESYARYIKGLRVVPVYGGENIVKQINDLKRKPQIVVATPGRLVDLIKRKRIDLSGIRYAILDEADEMLNMGFKDELDFILDTTPDERRTLLFSATMPAEVSRISKNYMSNPVEITVGTKNSSTKNVEHWFFTMRERNRYPALKRIVDINPSIYGIVFCRTRQETRDVAEKLMQDGYSADALHGDLTQPARDAVMQKFRSGNVQLLVATDVAARGLDVNELTHVINYNLPDDPEVYTHRSGRTGRAHSKGICISLANSSERQRLYRFQKVLKNKFIQKQVPSGQEVCETQLMSIVDKLQKVDVDQTQIDPFIERIEEKLAEMDREQIIRHFVGMEFSRFAEYYKNAPDLNVSDSDRGDRRNHHGDRGGYRSNERGERRGDRRGGRGPMTRFSIGMGEKQNFTPGKVLGMINNVVGDKTIGVGNIDIQHKVSYFDVDARHEQTVLEAFRKKFQGRRMSVEVVKSSGGGGGCQKRYNRKMSMPGK